MVDAVYTYFTNMTFTELPLCVYTACFYVGPDTPADVCSVVTCSSTVVVSWSPSFSGMCDALVTNYNLRYRLSSSSGDYITVNTSLTSVTLQGLMPNAEYEVEVAAINSNRATSKFSATTQFSVTPTTAPPSKTHHIPYQLYA